VLVEVHPPRDDKVMRPSLASCTRQHSTGSPDRPVQSLSRVSSRARSSVLAVGRSAVSSFQGARAWRAGDRGALCGDQQVGTGAERRPPS